jgi:hypothetical protein
LNIVSLDDGAPQQAVNIGNRGEDQASRVLHLWWPDDEASPELSYAAWNCNDSQGFQIPRSWRVAPGDFLTQAADGASLKVLDLSPNSQAILTPDMSAPLEAPGNLIIDIGGAKTGTRGAVNGIEVLSDS